MGNAGFVPGLVYAQTAHRVFSALAFEAAVSQSSAVDLSILKSFDILIQVARNTG